ncbi:MAG: bifunctional (p)ppGpp synthetase/guanosine-3',5'-bis(diphosphate) 3'-pyrophosphohydrolase [Clostridia bacterium]|nr:bifunctional (p)ppGpp synthetase/guanosine-3',5'-bis(diphosphate) 3'-pyrophosphohydrolase [Clostridia bacterium]MBT7121811.1 bifunctional (p)ppGpp synthetase/guanosine-3',5'-bis(diphosphate) 3'-pyrophosphohydrolase [Clostridia bacterium]
MHEGQMRLSGEPFFRHPYEVASILIDLGLDISTVIAGLFHDSVEDTEATVAQLSKEYGEDVATLVEGVTKVNRVDFLSKEDHQAENLRKMLLAMSSDIRVILVKLADRLHNMRTLKYQSKDKQLEKAKETLEIYAPLAHRLGINTMKWELEDLALKYIDPDGYYDIAGKLTQTRAERKDYIDTVINNIQEHLVKIKVKADIEGRPKHIYSIYNKINDQGRHFDEVYDLIAVRIIVKNVRDCYAVLGTVHTVWKPIPGRFKDYIAVPKQNMYQSIHTTVLGSDGRPFEVQIRTRDMHATAEYGIAAHWHYKEGILEEDSMDKKLTWLRELLEWQTDTKDSKEFMESLRIDFFSDMVFVFTPKGDVKEFVQGATPLDFAYSVHSAVGNKCVGAKVNGKIVQLTYEMVSGDIVEIITSNASNGPSRDWLKIVKTTQAKSKIRNWFRKEMKEENIVKGKDMLEREAKRKGYEFQTLFKSEWVKSVFKKFTLQSTDDMYAAVGYGGITTGQILTKLIGEYRKENKVEEAMQRTAKKPSKATVASGVIVKGYDDMLVRFAKCCNPVPGDKIVGYITRGRGVSVHRRDCSNINMDEFEEERMIDVKWAKDEVSSYNVEIQVTADDRSGLMAELTNQLYDMGYSITTVNARMGKNQIANIVIGLEIADLKQLDYIISQLEKMAGVTDVFRINK